MVGKSSSSTPSAPSKASAAAAKARIVTLQVSPEGLEELLLRLSIPVDEAPESRPTDSPAPVQSKSSGSKTSGSKSSGSKSLGTKSSASKSSSGTKSLANAASSLSSASKSSANAASSLSSASKSSANAASSLSSGSKSSGSKASESKSSGSKSSDSSTPEESSTEQLATATASGEDVDVASNADTAELKGAGAGDEETTPGKRKGAPGSKPALKRNLSATDVAAKQKSKPGPKKRKVEAPEAPETSNITTTTSSIKISVSSANSNPKLGPKANQGAINAGLRALDRSGKPCRKWTKSLREIKSFTGVTWHVSAWSAPRRAGDSFPGDVKSESSNSSEAKLNENSAVPSEKSNGGAVDGGTPSQDAMLPSSPAGEIAAEG